MEREPLALGPRFQGLRANGRGPAQKEDEAAMKTAPLRSMFSPRLALRELAPAERRRACDAGQRVVWTRSAVLPPWWDGETSEAWNEEIGALAQVCPRSSRPHTENPRKSGVRLLPCARGS